MGTERDWADMFGVFICYLTVRDKRLLWLKHWSDERQKVMIRLGIFGGGEK